MNFLDLFGGGGSHAQGTPSTAGASDGGKATVINDWLGRITGAYNAVTGAGTRGGPAPAPAAVMPQKSNTALYVGLAVAGLIVAFLLFRKR
jgi:hypothetical protein